MTYEKIDHWARLMYGKKASELTAAQKKKIPNYIKAREYDKITKNKWR
jgi:hypothetical protein